MLLTKIKRKILKTFHSRYAKFVFSAKTTELPQKYKERKNLFIYFDYEREFGGHRVDITNHDIENILSELDKRCIKATWFTVGLLIEKYPESIASILDNGHEVASHTYAHIKPLQESNAEFEEDTMSFEKAFSTFGKMRGFHAPEGKWSMEGVRVLQKYGYKYDLVSNPKNKNYKVQVLKSKEVFPFYRFETLGDDWMLYISNKNEQQCFEFFLQLALRLKKGEVGGLGFHPWVLFSNPSMYQGFLRFLDEIKNRDINIVSISEILGNLDSK